MMIMMIIVMMMIMMIMMITGMMMPSLAKLSKVKPHLAKFS